MWLVEVQLDGNPLPLTLCRCLDADGVAAVVRVLCSCSDTRPVTVRRDPLWQPDPVLLPFPDLDPA